MRLRLDNADTGNGLQLVPETYGMDVPSACTIVIIAGIFDWSTLPPIILFLWMCLLHELYLKEDKNFKKKKNYFAKQTSLGKYLDRVDGVMTEVDRITEDIAQMPVAAFIFRDKESDEVNYSLDIR